MRGSGNSTGTRALFYAVTRGNGPYLILLVLLNLLFFGDILFTENTYFYRDIAGYHHPLKRLVTEAYERGQWPLWNPYIQFGQPLLANPNALALYPTQLLFHVLPFDRALDLNLVLHALVGGIGAFYLARALNFSPIAALAVGIAFNFNGVVLSLINLPLLSAMAGLFPWMALFLKKVIQNPSAIRLAGLSVLFCLLFMLLEPLTTGAVFLFLVPFGVYVFLTRPTGVSWPKLILRLLLVLVSAVLLAGVLLVPAVEMINNSGRIGGMSFDIAGFWSFHPLNLTQMLFPKVWEDTFDLSDVDSLKFSPFFESREAYLVSCYSGLVCLVIALLGLLYSDKVALKRLLVAISLVAIVLALGKYTPVYGWLYHHVPPFRYGRFPSKYLLTLAMSLSLLTGLGIDQLRTLALQRGKPGGKRRFVSFLSVTVSLLVFAGLLALSISWEKAGFDITDNVIKLRYQGSDIKLQLSLIREAVFYLCLVVSGSLVIVLVAWYKIGSALPAVLVTALVFFDLLTNHSVNPVISSRIYERPPVADWLLERYSEEGLSRVYHPVAEGPIRILGKSDSLIWRVVFSRLAAGPYGSVGDHIHYSSFMPIDRLETLVSQVIDSELRTTKKLADRLDYLARLNTGYLVTTDQLNLAPLELRAAFQLNSDQLLRIYRLKNALPRAFLREWPTKNSRLEGTPDGVQITSYEAEKVTLSVTAARKSTLVLLDSYYPGWRVWTDGQEGRIEPVNQVFRGVVVPAGKHRVEFRYEPKSFRYGLTLTAVTAAGWIAALIFIRCRKYRRHKAGTEPAVEAELASH